MLLISYTYSFKFSNIYKDNIDLAKLGKYLVTNELTFYLFVVIVKKLYNIVKKLYKRGENRRPKDSGKRLVKGRLAHCSGLTSLQKVWSSRKMFFILRAKSRS